jgi:putative PEP-CTERM system TPR-repeat lipoprotein
MGLKLPRGLVFYLFALALLTACGDSLTDGDYVEQARASQAAGEVNAAIIQLKSALKLNPENFDARYLLGTIYLERGQLSDAEKELQKARQIDSGQEALLVPLARTLSGQGKYAELLEAVVPRDDIDRDSAAEIFSYRSQAWLALGDTTKAEVELSQAKALATDHIPVLLAEVRLSAKKGDVDTTRRQIQAVLAEAPDNAEAWSLLGSLEYTIGATEKADEAFSKAIASREDNSVDYLKRAVTRIALKDYEGAQQDINVAQDKAGKSPVALFAQGLLYFRQERYAEAQVPFENALNQSSDYMEAIFYLGATHLAQNHLSQAEFNLQRYIAAYPQSKPARSLLAQTYNKLGNPDRTLELLKPYLKGPQADPDFLTLAGQAYLLKEDPGAAATLLEEAAEQRPDVGVAHMMAGLALLEAGDETAGVESLETAASLGNEYRTNIALGFYYLNTGQFDKSLEAAAALENQHPDDPGVYNLKGRVYMGNGDYARARSNFEQALTLKPDLVTAILSLASLEIAQNNIPAARKRYESILDFDNKSTAAMIGLADLSRLEGEEDGYLSWVERAVKANPSALVPRVYLTDYYLKHGDTAAALRNAQAAVRANPEQASALALLGKVQLATGEKNEALTTFRKLATVAPDSAAAQDQLARAYAALGRIDDARERLQKALELDPGYLDAVNALSTLESLSGNHDEALKLARKYQELSPGTATGMMLEGDALMSSKNHAAALAAYEKALAQDAGDGRIAVKRHTAQLKMGQAGSADKSLMAWLDAHTGNVFARNYLARSFLKRGFNKEAMQQYEILAELTPTSAMTFNNLAILYQRSGDPKKALATAETAQRLSPESSEVADTLGFILLEQGQLSRGLELVKKAAAADVTDPERQYHLAFGLAKTGEADAARELLTQIQAMTLSPELKDQVSRLFDELSPPR